MLNAKVSKLMRIQIKLNFLLKINFYTPLHHLKNTCCPSVLIYLENKIKSQSNIINTVNS